MAASVGARAAVRVASSGASIPSRSAASGKAFSGRKSGGTLSSVQNGSRVQSMQAWEPKAGMECGQPGPKVLGRWSGDHWRVQGGGRGKVRG